MQLFFSLRIALLTSVSLTSSLWFLSVISSPPLILVIAVLGFALLVDRFRPPLVLFPLRSQSSGLLGIVRLENLCPPFVAFRAVVAHLINLSPLVSLAHLFLEAFFTALL